MGFVSLNVLLYVVQINGLENLALNQPTWGQYSWPDKSRDFGSENAVDGMYTDRGTNGGQCTISVDGVYNATLGVDLGRVVSISHIDIYYRTDNLGISYYMYTGRVAGFFVYVSNTTSKDDGYLCFHDKSTKEGMLSSDQHINCTVLGRYVIYYNERKPGVKYPTFYSKYAYHELCELEVYGCNGTYGEDCIYPCPTNCQDRRCDINTGLCFSCVPGYNGPKCNFGCQSGYYGRNCSHRCSENCIVTSQCDRFTGRCDGGCKPGWAGNTCNQIRATNTQPCSCTESYTIAIVVVSLLFVVTGSMINFIIWKRNAAKFSRMSLGDMPQPTSKREEKDHQYTELEEVDKSKTYEEIHSYSN